MKKNQLRSLAWVAAFRAVADSPEAFWKLLRQATDAITEVPEERWN